jgi:sec-independent protein translocase protein TatA
VPNLGVPELLIIALVIILLFGARKLPEMARSLGKSAKAFKEETKNLRGDKKDDEPAEPTASTRVESTVQQLPEAQPQAQAQNNGVQPVEQQNKNAS